MSLHRFWVKLYGFTPEFAVILRAILCHFQVLPRSNVAMRKMLHAPHAPSPTPNLNLHPFPHYTHCILQTWEISVKEDVTIDTPSWKEQLSSIH